MIVFSSPPAFAQPTADVLVTTNQATVLSAPTATGVTASLEELKTATASVGFHELVGAR